MDVHRAAQNTQMLREEKVPFLHDRLNLNISTNDLESDDTTHRTYGLYHRAIRLLIPAMWLITVVVLLMTNIWLYISLQRQNLMLRSSGMGGARFYEPPYCKQSSISIGLTPSEEPSDIPQAPADDAISYRIEPVHQYDKDDPLISPPGPGFDRAWSNLLAPFNIHVTAEEMRKANKQSFRIASGDDSSEEQYLAYLEVYHQLHCIKHMIQIRYPERYPHIVAAGLLSEEHFNHCTQTLRRAIMCHADISLGTFEWKTNDDMMKNDTETQPLMLGVGSPHIGGADGSVRKCIDWNRLDMWMRDRLVQPGQKVWGPGKTGYFGPE